MGQVQRAYELAESLLASPLPRRWSHTRGVAATAKRLAPILGDDAELIETAAWLHDIGYSPRLVSTQLHALDGARYLRDVERADPLICKLVAHHTGAIFEAQERCLEADLVSEFDTPPAELSKALTYCDITTSPDGQHVDVQKRLDEILRRYTPDHPVHRTVSKAYSLYLESVRYIEVRLTS